MKKSRERTARVQEKKDRNKILQKSGALIQLPTISTEVQSRNPLHLHQQRLVTKQLVPCDTTTMSCTPTSQPRIRTNIVPLKSVRLYIPDDDGSVPSAFMLGRHTISTAGGCCQEALLSGYFSALCAVLPDLTNIAKKVMTNLGFQAEEIKVPSQADRMNIVIPQSQILKVETIKFAQMCFLPFQNTFYSYDLVKRFWGEVAKDAGVVADDSSLMICSADGMETMNTALVESQLKGELQSSISSALPELAKESSPFGHIISEATKRAMNSSGLGFKLYSLTMKY